MTHTRRPKFKTIWDVIAAAKAEIEKLKSSPTPDLQAMKKQLKEYRLAAGYFFNVEHPLYKNVDAPSHDVGQYPGFCM